MLSYYCRHFPLVELNFTFYRLPTPQMLAKLASQAPNGFQFLVKLPQSLSHEESDRELGAFRQAVEELRSRDRLLGLLCQLPQATHHTPEHRRWIVSLSKQLEEYRLAVEFRHRSWLHAEVPAWLRELKTDLVAVDVPNLPVLYPPGLVQSGSRIYVRFHSRNADNWYRSDKDRYDYDYEDRTLEEWIDLLRANPNPTDSVLLLFNNCQRSQAAANAKRMQELLEKIDSGMEVVQPFAKPQAGAQQRLFFE